MKEIFISNPFKISWSEFEKACEKFCQQKTGANFFQNWEWKKIDSKGRIKNSYLCMKKIVCINSKNAKKDELVLNDSPQNRLLETDFSLEDSEPRPFCFTSGADSSNISPVFYRQFEYHIVYSFSYSVPVLYFQASRLDGSLLDWSSILAELPPEYSDKITANRFQSISQGEHPLLLTPFYYFHPCNTENFMKDVFEFSDQKFISPFYYLISWLSVVGKFVGLFFGVEEIFGEFFHKENETRGKNRV
eukprot:Sdes_comp16429_c0_seq1m5767